MKVLILPFILKMQGKISTFIYCTTTYFTFSKVVK